VDAGTNQTKVVEVDTVTSDAVIITVSVLFGGMTYTDMVTLTKVWDGKPAPVYAGVHDSMFYDIGGEPLLAGDCFLYMPKVGEAYDDTNPLFGHVLKWDGDSWESTTDSQSIGFAAKDAFAIARESGKVIFAAVIYTEAMVAANIQAGSGTGAAGSGFRFRAMDDDYSQAGAPKVPVFDVMYDNKKLFEVVATGTDAGDVIIGDYANGNGIKYDKSAGKFSVKGTIEAGSSVPYSTVSGAPPSNADNTSTFFESGTAFQTANGKVKIRNDGTIEAVDGRFTGDVFANSGYFKGIFDTTALKLEPGTGTTEDFTQPPGQYQGRDFYNAIIAAGYKANTFYKVSSPSTTVSFVDHDFSQGSGPFDLTDLTYIKLSLVNSQYYVHLYDSNMSVICFLGTYSYSWWAYTTTSLTLTIGIGGDKLLLSPDTPLTPIGLDDYQIYMDFATGNVKFKVPN
jgi:hypothetical protein